MPGNDLLHDIAVIMLVAGVVAIVFERLRLPLVLGYLVAGIIVGPHVCPVVGIHSMEGIHTLVDLGVAFLVFTIGLEFRLYKLKQIGPKAVIAGILEVALMLGVGSGLGRLFGWDALTSAYLGAMLVPCSTIILTKTLRETRREGRRFARFAVSLSIVEDMAVVLLIVGLTSAALTGKTSVAGLAATGLRIAVFAAAAVVLGLAVVPWLLNKLFKAHKNETLLVVTFGLCFGFALLSLRLGYSAALGAFIMGVIVAESLAREWIAQRLESMREFFTALFFVSIGILFDPGIFLDHWGMIAVVTAVFFAGKTAAVAFSSTVAGYSWKISLQSGLAMCVLGEFSFLLARIAVDNAGAPETAYPLMVSVCVVSAALSPVLVKRVDTVTAGMEQLLPRPLQSFLALYESRVTGSVSPDHRRSSWSFVRGPVWKLLGEALLAGALVPGCDYLVRRVFHLTPAVLPFHLDPDLITLALVTLLGLPLFVALWRNVEVIAMILSELAFPDSASRGTILLRQALQRVLVLLLTLTLVAGFGAVTQPFLPNIGLLIGFGTAGVLLAIWFWRDLIVLHQRVETSIQLSLEQATDLSTLARQEARQILEDHYPQNAALREVVLLPDAQAVGKTLRQLRLREETGATVLSLKRSGYELVNPAADTPLFPEDHLLLVGEPDHLRAAAVLLREAGSADPLEASRLWTLRLTAKSPALGRSLRELNLQHEAGVSVISLLRQGEVRVSPSPDCQLEEDDRITLFGTITQLAKAGAQIGGEIVEN